MYDMSDLAFTFLWIPIAVFVGAVSIAGMRTRALPWWIAECGAVLAAAAVVASAGVFAHSGFFAPTGTYAFIVFLAFAVWSLALSLVLMQKVGAAAGAPAMAAEQRPMATTT